MEQIFFLQADSVSACQDIPRLLLNSKLHYYVHNSPPLNPTLSESNPSHTPVSNSKSRVIIRYLGHAKESIQIH
jgi:hypothetical protein